MELDKAKVQYWKNKHGKHLYQLSLPQLDEEASNMWLSREHLFAETVVLGTQPVPFRHRISTLKAGTGW